MKKFRYRLEPLLKLRQQRERDRQREFGAAQRQVQSQLKMNEQVEQQRVDSLMWQRQQISGSLNLGALMTCSRFVRKLRRDTLSGQELLRLLELQADKKRQELVEASRECKKYEKLKERMQEKFDSSVRRLERIEADETAAMTHRNSSRR
ncbi:MAG: flagellar export protein FliJ [Candidatus Zixiibacteriota bacterium]